MIVFVSAFALGVLTSAAFWIATADWTEPVSKPEPVPDHHPAIIMQFAQRFGGLAK